MITYERGVEDFTLACGTAAGSTAAVLTALYPSRIRFELRFPGVILSVQTETKDGRPEQLFLTGPTVTVFSGEYEADK